MTKTQSDFINKWLTENFEKLADRFSKIETDYKNLCKFNLYWNLKTTNGRYAALLSETRLKELETIAADEMQEAHLLELDTDPRRLDGQNLETYEPNEEHQLDERTCRTNQYDGLLAPLPHEAR